MKLVHRAAKVLPVHRAIRGIKDTKDFKEKLAHRVSKAIRV